MHNFATYLAESNSHDPAFIDLYQRIFPDLASHTRIAIDCEAQRRGVDRILVLTSGQILKVEEKIRHTDKDDFLIEEYSNTQCRVPGWTVDDRKISDYLTYANAQLGIARFLPYPEVRRACIQHVDEWGEKYGRIRVANQDYVTTNIAVPWPILFYSIFQQTKYSFK